MAKLDLMKEAIDQAFKTVKIFKYIDNAGVMIDYDLSIELIKLEQVLNKLESK